MYRRRQKWLLLGLCAYCGGTKEDARKYCCHNCTSRQTESARTKRNKRKNLGLCCRCDCEAIGNVKYCMKHWVEAVCHKYFGRTINCDIATQKLIQQNFKCYYSGLKLTPGVNASADHKWPKIRYPKRKADVSNMVWCDIHINYMKRDLTEYEFINMCKTIVNFQRRKK